LLVAAIENPRLLAANLLMRTFSFSRNVTAKSMNTPLDPTAPNFKIFNINS
jgi:hypothetical protein